MDEASDFKIGMQLGFSRPIIKSHQTKKGHGPGIGELPKFGVAL